MGGRIYDPEVGRFIQADPFVQAPSNSQSLNRYSYVFNNPLSYTDPTGYDCHNRPGQACNSAIAQQKKEASEVAKQTLGETKQSEVNSGNSSADLPNSAKVANGNKSPELNSSDGWDYKGKPNGIDTYGKTYNRKDVFNTIDDSGALNLLSEFTLPWDAAACLHNGCGKVEWALATAAILPIGKYKKLDELSDVVKGASRVPGRVQSRINLSNDGIEHTISRHLNPAKAGNKSQFTLSGAELRSLLSAKSTVQAPATALETGNFARTITTNRTVGNLAEKMGGGSTNTFTVITDKFGNLQTAFPGGL